MGHTIPAKRWVIYSKLSNLRRFAKTLRDPYSSRLSLLAESVYQNISSIVFTNSLHDDEMVVYSMLVSRLDDLEIENKEKIMRCIAILLTE